MIFMEVLRILLGVQEGFSASPQHWGPVLCTSLKVDRMRPQPAKQAEFTVGSRVRVVTVTGL